MKESNLPFYSLFDAFRQNDDFKLGISEYFALLDALQGGFAMEKGVIDKGELLALCKLLWLKPDQSPWLFEDIFKQNIYKIGKNNEIQEQKNQKTPEIEPNEIPETEDEKKKRDSKNKDISKENEVENNKPKESKPTLSNSDEKVRLHITLGKPDGEQSGFTDENKERENRIFLLSDDYFPMNERQIQQIWRLLPEKTNAHFATKIDVSATIKDIAKKGVFQMPQYQKHQKNVNQVLWLADHQGSMIAFDALHEILSDNLKMAFNDYNHSIQNVKQFYFHNVPQEYLYHNVAHTEYIELDKFVTKYQNKPVAIVIFSDAGAARDSNSSARVRATIRSIFQLKNVTTKIIWLNPLPASRWKGTSAERIARFVNMYEANEKGLQNAVNYLKGKVLSQNK